MSWIFLVYIKLKKPGFFLMLSQFGLNVLCIVASLVRKHREVEKTEGGEAAGSMSPKTGENGE